MHGTFPCAEEYEYALSVGAIVTLGTYTVVWLCVPALFFFVLVRVLRWGTVRPTER
jgi:hypothetical protein